MELQPTFAPHFGGLWEAGVKSLKYHLKRVIGNSILCHVEFLRLVIQIEAVLNSQPICPLSNDANDVETLTPAHFPAGSSLVAVSEPDYTEIPMNRLS
ncbi:integrase catalytic domain-containing protein [Trichonephila clavipes]|uniref:Integrase catalytic domain-containing protein n=1 Tax=Trichonephila clavipes TaxID=2585209 RepID=A0A8X6RTH9_TRICX|nr:integrase catalytic domain-containing protein [Trichonephila clavipes]